MVKYLKPEVKVFSASDLAEVVGPIQTASATMNIYGGRTAQLDTANQPAEYRIAQADVNYEVINLKEVENA